MNAETETVVVETHDRADGVRVVTLNNPPVNAISSDMRRQLRDAMLAIDADGYGEGRRASPGRGGPLSPGQTSASSASRTGRIRRA